MSRTISKEKAEKIAKEYITNGYIKADAMLKCGYTRNYAYTGEGQHITFNNHQVIEAIKAEQHKLQHKLEITAEKVIKDLEEERSLALKKGDISSAIRASELQGKVIALFVDRSMEDHQPAQPLSPEVAAEARRQAAIRLLQVNRPGTDKADSEAKAG